MDSSRTLLADVNAADALLRVLAEGVFHIDSSGCIARANDAAQALTGLTAGELTGRHVRDLLHTTNAGDPLQHADGAEVELVFRGAGGTPLSFNGRVARIESGGEPAGWVLAFARRGFQEIEQLKDELVSTVSHELKTPLAAIKAYTATLRQNPQLYQNRSEEFLEVVESQADRLSRLIDDMLLVTRVESAHLLRRRVLVGLDEIVQSALAEIALNPEKHRIVRKGSNVQISGDPERLRDIFRNVIENAVKYSPAGGSIEITGTQTGSHYVIEVRDEGVGIDPADQPYVFERFYRAQSERTSGIGGSGLGLHIVQALVRAHGGSVEVRSNPDRGTCFTLRFPVRQ